MQEMAKKDGYILEQMTMQKKRQNTLHIVFFTLEKWKKSSR
jgi:hypothetical protein